MDPLTLKGIATTSQLQADGGVSQSVGQTSINQLGAQSQHSASHDSMQSRLTTRVWELHRPEEHSMQLEFQDTNLSPALSLLPANSRGELNFTEYSLFQQTDSEFAPLRAYPDVSIASERFHFPLHNQTTQTLDHKSLSQHPLAQATILSEERTSCFSVSQHSLSPEDEGRQEKMDNSHLIATGSKKKDSESPSSLITEAVEDEMFFLSKDVPAKQLLDRLQKDVCMLSSSSAFSSDSGTSVKSIACLDKESESTEFCKTGNDQSMVRKEDPPGEAPLPQQQTQQPDRISNPEKSKTLSFEVCNVTMGSRSTQPDDGTELLHRELLSEVERLSAFEFESKNQQQKILTPPGQSATPNPTEIPESKSGVTRTNRDGMPWTGPFSAGVIRIHREQDLWSSGNQTGIDGSYLGFLPPSQSTPGVLKGPLKSSVKSKFDQLSVVESSKDNSYQSNTGISTQQAVCEANLLDTATQCQEEASTAKVQSLPSLNYIQKVDAWRANQSSGNTSLFDSLALQGFSGIPPKKKAYDAVSDTLNRILTQQVENLQAPVSSAANQNVSWSSSSSPGSSSPMRGRTVGSAPNHKENTKSGAQPSSSTFGRSHSPLSTVVMLVQKDQQTETLADKEKSGDDVQQSSTTIQPSPLMTLGHFSDMSVDRDVVLSSSQDSYNSGNKSGASIGTSVISLEVDNYAPYLTSQLSTPPSLPRLRELNIEERIPLYLHNLGINQSPSAILTPFVPRGPIREPELSPTDLSTIKGSIGTPSKSTQPSEGGGRHKGEFSRSSILSVDSSSSIPFSLDSLCPAVSLLEHIKGACSSSDIETQSQPRLPSSPQPDEESHFSILQPSQQQQKDSSLISSQNADQPGERLDPDVLLDTNVWCMERNVSPMQTSCSMDQSARKSFVSSKALWEIRKLLSQAENVVSAGSSAATTSSAMVRCLHLDSDICQSTHTPVTEPAADKDPQDCTAGSSLVLSKSAQRAEPEGCSAAPPDNNFPTQPPVIKPLPSVSTQHMSTSSDTAEVPEEEVKTGLRGSAQSSSFSSIHSDTDQGVVSDASSESSLAVRVAKLLQSDSSATMVSSTNGITDQEESKARDWIRLKISGQQCESLELDKEDREQIEEIKRELLLKKPIKSQGSTDTESSAASSVSMRQDQPQPAETFATLGNVNIQLPQGLSIDLVDFSGQPQNPPRPDLEAQVRKIAAREGVTLPRIDHQSFTFITIATQRHSTSSSSSMLPAPPLSPPPEPLCLTKLSTGTVNHPENNRQLPPIQDEDKKTTEPEPVLEPSQILDTRNQNLNSHLMSGNHRQTTGGGQVEGCTSPLKDLDGEYVNVQESFVFDGRGTEQSTGATTSESPAPTSPISCVHLTLSTKAADHSLTVAVPSSDPADITGLQQKEFVPLKHSSDPSSPDEGVGLSSPPEWFDFREPKSQGRLKRTGNSNLFETIVPQERIISMPTQSITQQHKPEGSSRILTTNSSAVPVLLPYKPHGSGELFYVPQTEAGVSSVASSDTTMESSHTGSDDAVPPSFSSEVLGHQDPGLDRGVNIRHTEGIYSKRLKKSTFRMQQPEHTDKSSQTDMGQTPKMPSQASVAFARVPLSNKQEVTKRDQGTSPVQFLSYDQPEPTSTAFQTVHVEVDYNRMSHLSRNSAPEVGEEGDQQRRDSDFPQPTSQQRSSNLDELWQRFCDCLSLEEERPTNEREASLLERLERLSRLIHSTRAANVSGKQHDEYHSYSMKPKFEINPTKDERRHVVREAERHYDTRTMERNIRASRQAESAHTLTRRFQVEETLQPVKEDSCSSYASSLSHNSFQSQHLFPVDQAETETLSTLSTIDTTRLIRVFGAHRVQHLKTSSSLSKLYSTINKQKDRREQRGGRNRDRPHIITMSETAGTDNSVSSDSVTSTNIHTLPSHRGPSRSLAAKKSVRLVSKGIQAGNLEIICNGTRRHTRDVGTTYPSPHETRAPRMISSSPSSIERGRGGQRSPSKSQALQQQRKSKRSTSKPYPEGVSWFIPADNLRVEEKKENQPEKTSATMLSPTWFEPYSRRHPWREPLRQRQVHNYRNQESGFINDAEIDPEHRTKTVGLVRVSLQEALEMHHPEFISRSKQRVRCLALQVENRKLQSLFLRERDEYFKQFTRLPKPAGTAFLRRAVPRKEMLQRSKRIYESLPEVQRKREEERRTAEYKSYRLNAQLYNKRVTNHVLGRRSAWQ